MRSRPRVSVPSLCCAAILAAATPVSAQGPSPAPPPRTSPAPGQVLTLRDAIELALSQQPTIRSADQSRVAAQARIPEAQSAYYPRIDWVTSIGRAQSFSTTQGGTVQGNSTQTALQARQLIYDFGKTGAVVDEARAGARVADGELERVREIVVQSVRTAYFSLLQARRLVRVADASLERAELNLKSARGFFEVGTKPKSDVTKAEVEVANARVNVIRARNLVRLAEASLANALGLAATTPVEIEDILTYEPVALDPAALLAEALQARPELRQAQARLDAARAQFAGAKAGYWPDFNVTANYGGSTTDPSLSLFFDQDTWSVAANLSWNIFQGFFTQHRVRETRALVETARANAEVFELQVRLEVEQSYIAVTEAAERIGATDKAVESARENLRLAQGRYDAGIGTILDLTDAQLSLTQAEAEQIRALTDFRIGLAVLDRSVGRP